MSGSLSSRVVGLLGLGGAGLVGGLASGRPELAILAAPLIVFVGIGLALLEEPLVRASLTIDRSRILEHDAALATVGLQNRGSSTVAVEVSLRGGRHLTLDPPGPVLVLLRAGANRELGFTVRAGRWGLHELGPVAVQVRDRLGLARWERRLDRRLTLRVFPREQRLRALVAPLRTRPFLGSHVARSRGEGIEFADVRPLMPGDRSRQINWRATARRRALYVTERHPESSSDVVLLLDTFAEARDGASGTLDAAVRALASLARAYLARRDRVALVDFGGSLTWIEPAFGVAQLYRIIDALLASEVAFSYAWRAVGSIPRRVLPPAALVLVVSPLLDERSIRLMTELRTRGADLVVIEVSPLSHTSPGPTSADAAAYQLWRLQREATRARLRALGISVAVWNDDGHLGPALEGVNAFRRSLPHVVPA